MQLSDKIKSNLTGGHIQRMLDFLMHHSIEPIIRNSNVFDVQLVALLSMTIRNKKRKLSALDRDVFINRLSEALATSDREKKYSIICSSKIERGFIYNFVVNFLEQCNGYESLYHDYLTSREQLKRQLLDQRMKVIEDSVGTSRDRLLSTISIARDYQEQMYAFRNSIVEQYIRHSSQMARGFVKNKSNFSLSDVNQNFLAAITKAIDKYDSDQGALTSYVKLWIRNAQTNPNPEHGHEFGIAYSIPQQQKDKIAKGNSSTNNFSVSLDQLVGDEGESTLADTLIGDEGVEVHLERESELQKIRKLAKRADPTGIARLYLDIDEIMSGKEVQSMISHMERELGITYDLQSNRHKKVNNVSSVSTTSGKRTQLVRVASGSGSGKGRTRSSDQPRVVKNCKEKAGSTAGRSKVQVQPSAVSGSKQKAANNSSFAMFMEHFRK